MTSQTSGRRGLRSVSPAIAAPRLPPTIPRDVPELVGREDLLAAVAEELTSGSERWVTLVGTGGVGKTRLAVELARRLAPTFAGRCSSRRCRRCRTPISSSPRS